MMTAPASLGRDGARLRIAVGSHSGVDEEMFHCASGGDVVHGHGAACRGGDQAVVIACACARERRSHEQGDGLGERGEVKGDTQVVSAMIKERQHPSSVKMSGPAIVQG